MNCTLPTYEDYHVFDRTPFIVRGAFIPNGSVNRDKRTPHASYEPLPTSDGISLLFVFPKPREP